LHAKGKSEAQRGSSPARVRLLLASPGLSWPRPLATAYVISHAGLARRRQFETLVDEAGAPLEGVSRLVGQSLCPVPSPFSNVLELSWQRNQASLVAPSVCTNGPVQGHVPIGQLSTAARCPVGQGNGDVVYRAWGACLSYSPPTKASCRPTVADVDTFCTLLLHDSVNLYQSQTPSHCYSLLSLPSTKHPPRNTNPLYHYCCHCYHYDHHYHAFHNHGAPSLKSPQETW